jgi:hypothetical protein
MSRAHHPMTKQLPPNPARTTPVSKSLEERLNCHPELKTKIESLLVVVENAEGDLVKANEAEQRVIEEIRQLGQAALQEWATQQNQEQTDQFIQDNPQAQRTRKKHSTGTVVSDASKL